jgi:hypothetical protein
MRLPVLQLNEHTSGRLVAAGLWSAQQWLFVRQAIAGVIFGSSTDDLGPVIVAKFASNRRLGQKGLRLHQASGRMCELAGHPQHRRRVIAGAVLEIGRDLNRAEQNKRNEHHRSRSRDRCSRKSED